MICLARERESEKRMQKNNKNRRKIYAEDPWRRRARR
jgi:hypothetical protein